MSDSTQHLNGGDLTAGAELASESLHVDVPLSVTRAGYDPHREASRYAIRAELIANRYHYEKLIGRRKKDGAKKLKKLRPEHRQYVSCYVQGMSGVEIAEHFNVAAITVYRVLGDPLARGMIEEFDSNFKDEFRRMFPLVADVIRTGLNSGSAKVQMSAVDRFVKVSRMIDGKEKGDEGGARQQAIITARTRFVKLVKNAMGEEITTAVEIVEETTPVGTFSTQEPVSPNPRPFDTLASPDSSTFDQASLTGDRSSIEVSNA